MPRRAGFTLLEILIVLAILAVLATGALRVARPGGGRAAARAYRDALVAARLRAVAGATTSVRWEPEADAFVVRGPGAGEPLCGGRVRRRLPRPADVALARRLRDGIVWLPDGTGRACSGGGVYGGRVRFEGRRDAWDVVVASSGRIRLEPVR